MKTAVRIVAGVIGIAFLFAAGLVFVAELEGRPGFNRQTGVFVAMMAYGGLLIFYAVRGRLRGCTSNKDGKSLGH
jgi:hypothetical protein